MCYISLVLLLVPIHFLRLAFPTAPEIVKGQDCDVESLPNRQAKRHTVPQIGTRTCFCSVCGPSQEPAENCGDTELTDAAHRPFALVRQTTDYEISLLPAQEE